MIKICHTCIYQSRKYISTFLLKTYYKRIDLKYTFHSIAKPPSYFIRNFTVIKRLRSGHLELMLCSTVLKSSRYKTCLSIDYHKKYLSSELWWVGQIEYVKEIIKSSINILNTSLCLRISPKCTEYNPKILKREYVEKTFTNRPTRTYTQQCMSIIFERKIN